MRKLAFAILLLPTAALAQPVSQPDINQVQLQISGMMHDVESGVWQMANRIRQLEKEKQELQAQVQKLTAEKVKPPEAPKP